MNDLLIGGGILAVWAILQFVVFPKLGIPT